MHDAAQDEGRPIGYLFTDIDGSTERWERTPGEMTLAMARHDALIEDIVRRNGGEIQDHAGDGVFTVFREGDALACALELQRAFESENWDAIGGLAIRIGVHCGHEAPGGGVDKVSVNRAARITASAWGGQIVISSAAVGAYAAPKESELVDLGLHFLKGIEEPLRLFGLVHPALERGEFPPLRSLSSQNRTVPVQTSPIYGRASELADIVARLTAGARHITIVGPGGNGKTRLALEVAAAFSQEMPVYFVALDEVASSTGLIAALASALRFPFHHRTGQEDELIEYLREKRCLVVLDNAERLAGDAAFLSRISGACAGVRILATSREPLSLDAEFVFRLSGLPAPTRREGVSASAACALFVQAARAIDQEFELKDGDFETFRGICEAVGGSPLALHLTAQWTRLLSLDEILAKLRGGLSFLSELGGEGTQRGLRGVFEGSWALLSAEQRGDLTRLSVFQGGFDAQAARAVADAGIAALGALERKCLLERRGRRRFVMHPLIHDYAVEKLADAPGQLMGEMRRRHAEYFLSLVRQRFSAARGVDQGQILDQLQAESANMRAAWLYAVEAGDVARIREVVDPIFYFFVLRSMFRECAAFFDAPVEDGDLRWCFLAIRANCLTHQGEYEAAEEAARRVLASGVRDPVVAAHCYQALANIAHARGELSVARLHYERALSERIGAADHMGSYWSAISLAWLHLQRGDVAEAREWVKESHRLCQRIGHLGGMLSVHACAGDIAAREGRAGDAQASYREALKVEESVHHPQHRAQTLIKLGGICSDQGQFDQAVASFAEALDIAELVGDQRIVVNSLVALGRNLRLKGDPQAAKARLQRALTLSRELASRPQLAAALIELARVELALGETKAAARIAGLLAALDVDTHQAGYAALIAELAPERPDAPLDGDLDEALLALVNEPEFGLLRL